MPSPPTSRTTSRSKTRRSPSSCASGFWPCSASAPSARLAVRQRDRGGVEPLETCIADGLDGPFQLEVDWIRAYADDA